MPLYHQIPLEPSSFVLFLHVHDQALALPYTYEYCALILHTKGTFSSFVLDLLYVYEKSLVGLVVRAEKVAEYVYLTVDSR
jgi:hypothetical protein